MGWPVVLASGGPRERGRAYGAAAASRIHASLQLYEAVFRRYADLPWRDVRHRAGAFVEPIDAFDLELLPEIEGIAEGAGVDAEDVLALNLRTEVMFGLGAGRRAPVECTAVAIADAAGGPIVAQNWDWKPGARDTCVILASAAHGRPGFVTVVEAGLLAKFGLNDRGLALATNALTSSLDRGEPGVPYHAILRAILTSDTFDDAVATITNAARASSANYVIGSADGRVVDLEVTPGHGPAAVRASSGPRLAHANHFTWPAPRRFKDVGRIDGEDSVRRHDIAAEAIAGEVAGEDDVHRILRDHAGHPSSVCAHDDPTVDAVDDYLTVASFVASLGDGRAWVTAGNPCEQPYEPLDVDTLIRAAAASTATPTPPGAASATLR